MSNYRKTMAEALREMYPLTEETQLDEAEKRDAGYPDDSVKIGKKHWIIYRDRKYWYGYEIDKKGNQIGDVISLILEPAGPVTPRTRPRPRVT